MCKQKPFFLYIRRKCSAYLKQETRFPGLISTNFTVNKRAWSRFLYVKGKAVNHRSMQPIKRNHPGFFENIVSRRSSAMENNLILRCSKGLNVYRIFIYNFIWQLLCYFNSFTFFTDSFLLSLPMQYNVKVKPLLHP
jgi:hypothetical protein